MKIKQIGEGRVIMSNPTSYFKYFAWPTVCRLKNGRLALGASGYRLSHVCPFGKSVMSISEDEGESWTIPSPVIDTVLDDRDVGVAAFGESGLIFTSFNNTADYQRSVIDKYKKGETEAAFRASYLDMVKKEDEDKYIGSTFRISYDNGVTFGPIYKSPITSPHGPTELSDGSVMWLGRTFDEREVNDRIEAHILDTKTGKMQLVGFIDDIEIDGKKVLACEPHAVQTPSGRIICHVRIQSENRMNGGKVFTIYQSVSDDLGKTWSKPVQILGDKDGAPPHLMISSKGDIICVYARRDEPYSIKAMISRDDGESWESEHLIFNCPVKVPDHGYPATVELKDGSFLTVFYTREEEGGPTVIWQQKWCIEE
ncbi:MAG: exo-alpha-sialidase [Clostridia bacterium]|nr:exo-alpha-sialidase [Clostridia bacterium]